MQIKKKKKNLQNEYGKERWKTELEFLSPEEETSHPHTVSRRSGKHALARSTHKMQAYTILPFSHGLTPVCHPCSQKTAHGAGLHLQSVIDDGEHHQDGLFCLWLGVESDVQEKKSSEFGNSVGKKLKFIFNLRVPKKELNL